MATQKSDLEPGAIQILELWEKWRPNAYRRYLKLGTLFDKVKETEDLILTTGNQLWEQGMPMPEAHEQAMREFAWIPDLPPMRDDD